MKKIVLACLPVLSATLSHAQLDKGRVGIGGTFGVSTNKVEATPFSPAYSTTQTYVSPSVSLFVRNNVALGLHGYYSNGTDNNNGPGFENTNRSYGGGISLRKFWPIANNFFVFGQTGINVQAGKGTYWQNGMQEVRNRAFGANAYLYPGISYLFRDRFQLEASLTNLLNISYTQNTTNNPSNPNVQQKSSALNLSTSAATQNPLSVGFSVLLGKRRS
ncbi:hypothetical protein [Flaviaesturariibacter amylovorans]|uniref:Outer membrane protein beta-barrel domain-containing protein n=1 Tax=Flaviaesturariibacter amylovorans TaxID=1084520 RepID=A0ABP8GA69_9BACT